MLLITTFYLIWMSHIRNPSSPPFPSGCLAPGILHRRLFHPGVPHPEFLSAVISIRMSHTRNPSLPPFPSGCLALGILLHHHFHPDVLHPKFFFAAIPSGCLTSRILPGRPSTFFGYLTSGILSADVPSSPDVSHLEFYPADVPPFSSSLEHFL